MEQIVIIGNGPAGATAAIYAARAGLKPIVFAGNVPGGLLTQTGDVENFPGFPNGINGFDLVMDIQFQAEKFGAMFEYEEITSAKLSPGGPHTLTVSDGRTIECRTLIIAAGAAPRKLDVPAKNGCTAKEFRPVRLAMVPFTKMSRSWSPEAVIRQWKKLSFSPVLLQKYILSTDGMNCVPL